MANTRRDTANCTKSAEIEHSPERELFFTIRDMLENEGENLFVHKVATFLIPESEKPLMLPKDFRDYCQEREWLPVALNLENNDGAMVFVTAQGLTTEDLQKRKELHGKLSSSFVVLVRSGVWHWEEKVPACKDVLDVPEWHRAARAVRLAVENHR